MYRYSGAVIMYLITNLKLKKKYGIEDGKEREALYEAVNEWVGLFIALFNLRNHYFQWR